MRITFALIFSILLAVGLVAFGFTYFQVSSERSRLEAEVEQSSKEIAGSIIERDDTFLNSAGQKEITLYEDSIRAKFKILGIAVYHSSDSVFSSTRTSPLVKQSLQYIPLSSFTGDPLGVFGTVAGKNIYQHIWPVKKADKFEYSLLTYTDTEFVRQTLSKIWLNNFMRWFIQAFLVSVLTVLIIRWGVFTQVNKIVAWIKSVRSGNTEELKTVKPMKILVPLHKELEHIAKVLNEAKASADEEARLRTSAEAIWTPERLKVEVENLLHRKKMIVVSNREPYMHMHEGKGIKCIVPASGMITAMEPILKSCSGLWIAAGTGDADRETVDSNDRIQVPPEEPKYTLRRLWLTDEEEKHFYYGFSNEGLWPLCHIAHTRPLFRFDDWEYYKKVNEDFARAVIEESADEEQPYVLIQDFHFALLPELVKKAKPKAKVAIFWHIPWPNPESFGICPWQREILLGMLGADLIGFHTQYHCNHFLETVSTALESRVLWDNFSIKRAGRTTFVKPFPISISFTLKDYDNRTQKTDISKLLSEYGITAMRIGIGVDRIDYTKGIVEKFLAVERFFEKNPTYTGKFTFVQIGAPSRTLIKSYIDTVKAVEDEAERINLRFKTRNWKPILFLKRHHSHEEIAPFYVSADFCMVTSLHDGMNLVAKEFVASRNYNDGTLILSRFAGASQELQGAIVINPYDIERSADAIKQALEMSQEEQNQRMKQMRLVIVRQNIYYWAADLLRTMASIKS